MQRLKLRSDQPGFVPPYPTPGPPPAKPSPYLRGLMVLPQLISNPIKSFTQNYFEEPVVHSQIFHRRLVLINDPDMIRHVFVDHANDLVQDSVRQAVLRPVLRDGMLTAEGEIWRRSRRTIAPVFAPRNVAAFGPAMINATDQFLADMPVGNVQIAQEMTRLTYRVLSETLFSGDLDDKADQVLSDTAYFLSYLGQPDPVDLLNAPTWIPRLTKLRGGSAVRRLRATVRDTAEQRAKRIVEGKSVPPDFLTLLLEAGESEQNRLSLAEIEDNIITFIAAGHETTARAMAWLLYLLAFDDAARRRCEEEVDGFDFNKTPADKWQAGLPWLAACLEEAMRLFPPAPIIARNLTKDIQFKGMAIKADTNVVVAPYVLHRHKELWDRPEEFHPERFFGENRKLIGRFSYLPFGLGQRVCIGSSFAMQEAMIMLASFLRDFTFTYPGKEKPLPVMKITLQPDNGVPMRVQRRAN